MVSENSTVSVYETSHLQSQAHTHPSCTRTPLFTAFRKQWSKNYGIVSPLCDNTSSGQVQSLLLSHYWQEAATTPLFIYPPNPKHLCRKH